MDLLINLDCARLPPVVFPALCEARPDTTVVGVGGEFIRPIHELVARAGPARAVSSMDAFSVHPFKTVRRQIPQQSAIE